MDDRSRLAALSIMINWLELDVHLSYLFPGLFQDLCNFRLKVRGIVHVHLARYRRRQIYKH